MLQLQSKFQTKTSTSVKMNVTNTCIIQVNHRRIEAGLVDGMAAEVVDDASGRNGVELLSVRSLSPLTPLMSYGRAVDRC